MIDFNEFKKKYHYEPATGLFYSADCRCTPLKTKTTLGYGKISYKGKTYAMHRLAFLYMTGSLPEKFVDHIDGDPTNNKWSNLREVTQAQNMANCKKPVTNKSGYKGVVRARAKKKERWIAQIHSKDKQIYLGTFDKIEDAAQAYEKAAIEYFGEYARVI